MANGAGGIPPSNWDRFWQASTSGLFFMAIGSLFLFVASLTMGSAYAIFSFVLVVLGVAILLFGTGTQSMGEFNSNSEAAKYKVAIAGGAGVLAFCAAIGIVQYSPKMKSAFQIEKRYVLVLLEAKADGSSTFDNYVAEFTLDGTPIPAMRRGKYVVIYVPYLESEKAAKRKITYVFQNVQPSSNQSLVIRVENAFEIEIADQQFLRNDAFFDFPVYKTVPVVDLKSSSSAVTTLDKASQNRPAGSPGDSVPPPKLPTPGNI